MQDIWDRITSWLSIQASLMVNMTCYAHISLHSFPGDLDEDDCIAIPLLTN